MSAVALGQQAASEVEHDSSADPAQATVVAVGVPSPADDLRGYRQPDDVSSLPHEVQALLHERVHGLEHVELLLHLRRCAPEASTASRLAVQLPWPAWVEGTLGELCEAGLLVVHDSGRERLFVYGPATSELDAAVAMLDEAYGERRADVIKALNEHALERLRSEVSRAFTTAFGTKKNDV